MSSDILIVGTGALACYCAARLSAAGISVVMLGSWVAGVAALAQDGVRLVLDDGSEKRYPVSVTTDPRSIQEIRLSFVLVKSWQTERAARQLETCLSPDGVTLSLQNGMGNYEILCDHLGASRVAQGATTTGAYLLSPGVVKPAGEGVITLGVHARIKPLAETLAKAGFFVENQPDLQAMLWGKLVINAAINPLSALLRVPNGELLVSPDSRAVMASAAREAAAVAVARGVNLPFPDPAVAAEAIARRTATNYSSMLQDVRRGAPTEIDAICGAIVRHGDQTGVPTPVNRTLQLLVRAMVNQNSGLP